MFGPIHPQSVMHELNKFFDALEVRVSNVQKSKSISFSLGASSWPLLAVHKLQTPPYCGYVAALVPLTHLHTCLKQEQHLPNDPQTPSRSIYVVIKVPSNLCGSCNLDSSMPLHAPDSWPRALSALCGLICLTNSFFRLAANAYLTLLSGTPEH